VGASERGGSRMAGPDRQARGTGTDRWRPRQPGCGRAAPEGPPPAAAKYAPRTRAVCRRLRAGRVGRAARKFNVHPPSAPRAPPLPRRRPPPAPIFPPRKTGCAGHAPRQSCQSPVPKTNRMAFTSPQWEAMAGEGRGVRGGARPGRGRVRLWPGAPGAGPQGAVLCGSQSHAQMGGGREGWVLLDPPQQRRGRTPEVGAVTGHAGAGRRGRQAAAAPLVPTQHIPLELRGRRGARGKEKSWAKKGSAR
jgi:hypothetical protein